MLLTAVVAALGLWKPDLRRESHYVPRLVGWFFLVFVLSLFRYGVLHLSNAVAGGLLFAWVGAWAALHWRNRRRMRS